MTNKIKFSFFFAIMVLATIIASCDKVSPPFDETGSGGNPNPDVTVQKVLIEDFTGHTCKNCPAASKIAENIQKAYPGRVVVMAIHSGFYADTGATGNFTYNFRIPEGQQISDDFGISSWPNGMVNRRKYNGSPITGKDSWSSHTGLWLQETPKASIKISNVYNDATRNITTTITSKALKDLTGQYKLAVFYTEDSIIKPQIVDNTTVLDYVHMHALRGAFNGAYGEVVMNNPATNDSIVKTYSLTLRADAVAKNCHVVAYIIDETSKEIIQVEEKEMK